MNTSFDVSNLVLSEYVDFLESRALHLGIDPHELNMAYFFEARSISMARYELAKCELYKRAFTPLESDDVCKFA